MIEKCKLVLEKKRKKEGKGQVDWTKMKVEKRDRN